jgi:dTDP-4-amino-4,6-dideoxygalactose transaminase
MNVTQRQAESLIRLPMWIGLSQEQQARVVEVLQEAAGEKQSYLNI